LRGESFSVDRVDVRFKVIRVLTRDKGAIMKKNRVRPISGVIVGIALVSMALPARGEVKFLKVKFSSAQEELGWAIRDAAQIRFQGGSAPEKSFSEERLGTAIVRSAQIALSEKAIVGEARREFGKMSLAVSRGYPISPEAQQAEAQRRAGKLQELLGIEIVKKARLNWAEGELNRAVQKAIASPAIPQSISERLGESLSVIDHELGYATQDDLRTGFAVLKTKTGEPYSDFLPKPLTPRPNPTRYAEAGWGEFWEVGFFSLIAFLTTWWIFSWVLRDLDRRPPGERMKEPLPKAA
jgi:hypothetical protein